MFKHILIPTDGSEVSGKAIRAGVEYAHSVGAKVTALYCGYRYPAAAKFAEPWFRVLSPEQFDEQQKQWGEKYLSVVQAAAQVANVPCEAVYVVDDAPWKAILKTAAERGCDLIFMASHGRSGVEDVLLGSETNKVLTHSRIPVLVYR